MNWGDHNSALKQRGSSLIWYDPEMGGVAAPSSRRGRSPRSSDAAIQTCLVLKAFSGLPLRLAIGLVASLLRLAKLDWPVSDFSTLRRRQNALTVTIPYRPSGGLLRVLVDGTGIKSMGEGEWSWRKHAASRPRHWSKLRLDIDAETFEVRAIKGEQANATGPSEPASKLPLRSRDLAKPERVPPTRSHRMKLLGERLSARTFDPQTAELQARAALLNRFTALGTPETVRVARADGDPVKVAFKPSSATEPVKALMKTAFGHQPRVEGPLLCPSRIVMAPSN